MAHQGPSRSTLKTLARFCSSWPSFGYHHRQPLRFAELGNYYVDLRREDIAADRARSEPVITSTAKSTDQLQESACCAHLMIGGQLNKLFWNGCAQPNKRWKLTARVDYGNESSQRAAA